MKKRFIDALKECKTDQDYAYVVAEIIDHHEGSLWSAVLATFQTDPKTDPMKYAQRMWEKSHFDYPLARVGLNLNFSERPDKDKIIEEGENSFFVKKFMQKGKITRDDLTDKEKKMIDKIFANDNDETD